MITRRAPFLFVALLACSVLAGCGKKTGDASGENHAGHEHHEHKAPHGGTLVEIGEHQFNLEFVRDEKAGTLTAYVLDAHAENFVRLALPAIVVNAQIGGRTETLSLTAVANPATGETVGDTSQFTATAAWLKTAAHFDATIPALEIRGAKFTPVKFHLHDEEDDHRH